MIINNIKHWLLEMENIYKKIELSVDFDVDEVSHQLGMIFFSIFNLTYIYEKDFDNLDLYDIEYITSIIIAVQNKFINLYNYLLLLKKYNKSKKLKEILLLISSFFGNFSQIFLDQILKNIDEISTRTQENVEYEKKFISIMDKMFYILYSNGESFDPNYIIYRKKYFNKLSDIVYQLHNNKVNQNTGYYNIYYEYRIIEFFSFLFKKIANQESEDSIISIIREIQTSILNEKSRIGLDLRGIEKIIHSINPVFNNIIYEDYDSLILQPKKDFTLLICCSGVTHYAINFPPYRIGFTTKSNLVDKIEDSTYNITESILFKEMFYAIKYKKKVSIYNNRFTLFRKKPDNLKIIKIIDLLIRLMIKPSFENFSDTFKYAFVNLIDKEKITVDQALQIIKSQNEEIIKLSQDHDRKIKNMEKSIERIKGQFDLQ